MSKVNSKRKTKSSFQIYKQVTLLMNNTTNRRSDYKNINKLETQITLAADYKYELEKRGWVDNGKANKATYTTTGHSKENQTKG